MRTEQLTKCIEPLQNLKVSFPLYNMFKLFEPRHEKTGFLQMRKQRRRSAVR